MNSARSATLVPDGRDLALSRRAADQQDRSSGRVCGRAERRVARRANSKRSRRSNAGVAMDMQVDFTGGRSETGGARATVDGLVTRARELNLKVRGLMVVAPPGEERTREAFASTVALADRLGVKERSMGMSEDLEMACELGTTEVRLGRALFGPRQSLGAWPNMVPGVLPRRRG